MAHLPHIRILSYIRDIKNQIPFFFPPQDARTSPVYIARLPLTSFLSDIRDLIFFSFPPFSFFFSGGAYQPGVYHTSAAAGASSANAPLRGVPATGFSSSCQ